MRHPFPDLARLPLALILTAALGLAAAAPLRADPDETLYTLLVQDDETAALADLAALRAQPHDDRAAEALFQATHDAVFDLTFAYPPRERLRAAVLDWQVELAGRVFGEVSRERAEALMALSDARLVGLADPAGALEPAEAAVALLRAAPETLAPLAEPLLTALAHVHRGLDEPARAVPLRREAPAILQADPATDARALSGRGIDLAIDLAAQGPADDAEAEALMRGAVAALRAAAGADDIGTIDAQIELGAFLTSRARAVEAEAELAPARQRLEARVAQTDFDVARVIPLLGTLARIEIAAGRPEQATAIYLRIAERLRAHAARDPDSARELARGLLNEMRWLRVDHPAAAALAASWPDL